jgi:hypothetical protein
MIEMGKHNGERNNLADRSLDRANLMMARAEKGPLQSRQDLLKNEYKKVIENHPKMMGQNN